jgi:sulfur carrier protein
VHLMINGVQRDLDVATLDELLAHVAGNTRGSAAAVDGEVVPRGLWLEFALREGQSIEILTAVQGG